MPEHTVLAGDIGGTNARLAIAVVETKPARVELAFQRRYEVAGTASFDGPLHRFLEEADVALPGRRPSRACLALAGPVQRDRVRLTNADWTIEAAAVARALGGATVVLVNDLFAAARGLDALPPDRFSTLQSAMPDARKPELVISAGTGLGIAFRVPQRDSVRILDGEGGHVGFAPADDCQQALARWLRARFGRVSAEQVVSGPGIVRIDRFLRESNGVRVEAEGDAAQVAARARAGDAVAQRALELFAECYGAVAGDFALALGAAGGVVVCGSLAADLLRLPGLGSAFLRGFTAKGPHAALAAGISVRLAPDVPLGVLGAALIACDGDAQVV